MSNKILIMLFLAVVMSAGALSADAVEPNSKNYTLFTNQSSAYTGPSIRPPFASSMFTYTVDIKGNPVAVNVAIQGAIADPVTNNCGTWANFAQYSGLSLKSTTAHQADKPLDCVRGKITTFTNGTSVTVKIKHMP